MCFSLRKTPYFSCFPLSSLAVPVDHLRVWLLFIFLYHLLISLVSCHSLYGSSSFMSAVFLVCRGLSSCCSSMVASFEFFYTYAPRSHSLYPSFVWVCLPGSGAFLFPPAFLPCHGLSGGSLSVAYPYAVHDPLAGGHAFHFC